MVRQQGRARPVKAAMWIMSAVASAFYLGMLAEMAADWKSARPLSPLPARNPESAGAPPERAPDFVPAPWVSIILPVRDEEQNIEACVRSLLSQDYDNFEVIVVDDGSTDATPDILAELAETSPGRSHLRVVRLDDLPARWAGKPHALHRGTRAAHAGPGDWLLFTDADTRHTATALRSAVLRALQEGADLFTIGTAQELPDFWNRVLMPIAYMGISAQYPPAWVNQPHCPVAIANGQFLLIRREMYERVGGYDTDELRGTVVDDLALARVVKCSGGKLRLVDGRGLVRVRMYRSLREHMNGWGKNATLGSRGGVWLFPLFLVGLPAVTVWPFVALALGLLSRKRGLAAAGALSVTAALAYRVNVDRQLGIPLRYGWTHPLGGAIFTFIISRSFWRRLRNETVPWRGRSYPA
jgi:chlorobactene glucosyltransferase